MPIEDKIMKRFDQGDFGPEDAKKKGKGGEVNSKVVSGGSHALTEKSSAPGGPGVNSAFWAKHGDKALTKDFK